ncbi:MAG: hypothetical protein RIQ47_1254 [Bacteroidota bacterium]|jgi:hypothetical protein
MRTIYKLQVLESCLAVWINFNLIRFIFYQYVLTLLIKRQLIHYIQETDAISNYF